jgi:uncharacterized protein (TIGR02266 family)
MGAPRKTLRVLLVDDEEHHRRALEKRLSSHEVFVAGSYDQAGDVLRRKTLDVVISDNRMPGPSGLEVLQLAARLQPDARRIMFSGKPPENLQRLLERETIHHFFPKGEDQQLIDLIETLAGGPASELRRSARFASDGPVEIRCESWGQFIKTYTKDINHGGLFIQTGTPPPVNTELEVRISLPAGHSLQLTARVVHLITPERAAAEGLTAGVGVQFLGLDERHRSQIQTLVELARQHAGQGDARRSPPAAAPDPPRPARPPDAEETAPRRSAEQNEMIRRLRTELNRIKAQDELAILGLDQPDAQAAKRAFHRLSKRYHPDTFGKYGDPEIDRLATEIFIVMKRALTRVRQTTLQQVPRVASSPAPPRKTAQPEAEIPSLKKALQRIAREQYVEAAQELERILAEDAKNTAAQTWLYLVQARQLRAKGADREALAKYHAVLKLDERNLEAVKEVRDICEARRRMTRPLRRPKGG